MSATVRIGLFALILGLVFAGAAAIGVAVGPLERGKSGEPDHAASPRRVVADGYTIVLGAGRIRAGERTTLAFGVARGGRLIAVRKGRLVLRREGSRLDVQRDRGALAFDTTFPSPGRYRAVLRFRHDGARHTAAFNLDVGE